MFARAVAARDWSISSEMSWPPGGSAWAIQSAE